MLASDRPLTRRQAEVMTFVTGRIRLGDPPTEEEISVNFGWSSANSAHEHVIALVRKGFLLRARNRSRGLSLPIATDPLPIVRSAILEYHAALDRREHGGVAQGRALDAIEGALGLHRA